MRERRRGRLESLSITAGFMVKGGSVIDFPAPNLIGAPARYDRWRSMQAEAVLAAADSRKRCVIQGAPTGFGKSLVNVSQALLTDSRTVILTATKALQRQYLGDFIESGMIEIRGLNSYECIEGQPGGRFGDMRREGYRAERGMPMMCDEAPCQAGAFCPKREGGCAYYDANRKASLLTSKLIITNYAYWMSIHKFGEGLGKVDLLVLDEAHEAIDELGSFIGTEIKEGEIESVLPSNAKPLAEGADQHDWTTWAGYWYVRTTAELDSIRMSIKESERTGTNRTGEGINYGALRRARDLRRVQHKLHTIANLRGDWIIEHTQDERRRGIVKFDPIWPGEYAESNLFLSVPKVVMVSATVRPKTAMMLGLGMADIDFREYPSSFPKAHRPTVFIPTVAMNRNSAAAGKREWHTRIDQIIARRLDRAGIIHTVSYERAREVYKASEYRDRMLIHDSLNTREVIETFKQSTRPLILVSPVVHTGYDFPDSQARWQLLVKMPFPVTTDKIMKARAERDKEYKDYITMIKLVQTAGRIVRSEQDWGETIIIDSDFGWWWNKVGYKIAPRWFTETLRTEQTLWMPLSGPVA